MSDELDGLRIELDVLERYAGDHVDIREAEKAVRLKIARLEAEADPWREAKEAIQPHMESGGHKVKAVARYARHLEDKGVGKSMKIAGLQAENERLAARVAELENEPEPAKVTLRRAEEVKVGDVILAGGYTQTVTKVEPETTQRIIKCDGWMDWFRNRELVAVINGDSNPDDPILDPARVIDTAIKYLCGADDKNKANMGLGLAIAFPHHAKPYRLKGADDA